MECKDKNCPMHGSLRVRGMIVTGKVVSTKMKKSVVVERDLLKPISKYKRRAKTKSKLHAHLPECIKADLGDDVEIGQTRKLSKTKGWVVLKVIKTETSGSGKEEPKEKAKEEKKHAAKAHIRKEEKTEKKKGEEE